MLYVCILLFTFFAFATDDEVPPEAPEATESSLEGPEVAEAQVPEPAPPAPCDVPSGAENTCQVVDQLKVTLALKKQEIKTKEDIDAYLILHNQAAACPTFGEICPSFTLKTTLGPVGEFTVNHEYYSLSSPCKLGKPAHIYHLKDTPILQHLGTNVLIKFESQCNDGTTMAFTAYKGGFLTMAGADVPYESQAVARRIQLPMSDPRVEAPDGKTLRIVWPGKDKDNWLDVDPETMKFKDSSFIKVEQINSGSCKTEKAVQPKSICDSIRKKLIDYGSIQKPEEYECIEYLPVFEGVQSRISRG